MKNRTLTLGSLFDGSGGFPLGGILAGITPLWSSEIEPFPVLVTHKRLPTVKHYGDVSKLSGAELEPVDIITFGSPCQDLSIAGKRAGIQEGERSNLFFQAIRIIKEMREKTNGAYPRYCVWENVPGAFSSNGGEDFRAVLEAVIGVKEEGVEVPAPKDHRWPKADVYLGDRWSVAYRVLDAQYWGVPQRRSRIYLVGDFTGGSAGEVLFKSEGLSRYSPQGIRSWERTAGGAEEGTGAAGGGVDHRGGDGRFCVNTQGNSGVGITEEQTLALVAQDHGNHPAVLQAAGFSTEHSAKARSIGYGEEVSPTLRAGVVPAAMMFDNHAQDARYDGPLEESPTVMARYGTGGNNQPLVAVPEPITLKIRCGNPGGGKASHKKGVILQHDKSATHGTNNDQTLFQPEVRAYGVCSKSSYAMLSDNPRSGFYEAKTSRTLDQSGGSPVCNQGGICVVAPDTAYALQGSIIGRKDKNGPQGDGVNEEVSFTLNTTDKHAVAAPTYCATTGSFMEVTEEKSSTLMARDYKDPKIVNDAPNDEPVYIVRRLTPVECARLQGFPDWWCAGLAIPDPTEEEITFWTEVWETWRKVTNPEGKPKTEKQIRKWLADPYTDAAEYKLWGNGVCANNTFFVLAGIAWAQQQ
ncbi:MAG: DNA cytosine methyltransferase [Clostridia bacterium]|nr:DNA cytosine methyltransferase [Clostridia bacterium]